jgi:serine/threonine-protein kinase
MFAAMHTTLQVYLQQHVPGTVGLCRLLARMAEALADWQRAHGPHGALTPTAITIAADGTIRIEAPATTGDGFLADAMAYRSPAQFAAGDTASQACAEDDVYALGVIAWECLTGMAPFEVGFLPAAEAAEVLRSGGGPQGALPHGLPERGARTLRAALALRPQRRPTAEALALALAGARTARSPLDVAILAALAAVALGAALTALWLIVGTC